MKNSSNRSSDTLLALVHNKKFSGDLTFQTILYALGERAFGIILLFFALPNALPLSAVPGVSVVFSVPIAIIAWQMIFSRKTLWLPKAIAQRTIHHDTIIKVVHRALPYLIKIERFLKPRWRFMTSRYMEMVHGSLILCLSLLLMLPIPFSNFILSMLIILVSLGLIEKDGLVIVVGYIGAIIYGSFIYMIVLAVIQRIFS